MIRQRHNTASKRLHGALVFLALCAPGVVLSEVTTGVPGALHMVGRIEQQLRAPFVLATAPPHAVAGMDQYSLAPSAYGDANIAVIKANTAAHDTVTPAPAIAQVQTIADLHPAPTVVHIQLTVDGKTAEATTSTATVGAVLAERGVVPTASDAVSPAISTELRNGMNVSYRKSAAFTLFADGGNRTISSRGDTVAEILNENHIRVDRNDRVHPARNADVPADHVIRIERVHTWTQRIYANVNMPVIHRKDATIARGKERVVAAGLRGLRETTIEYIAVDGKSATHRVIKQRMARTVKPRIVAVGTRTPLSGFSAFAARAFSRTEAMAHGALSMIATAYTAYCSSCSGTGRGATGMSVHHGVVAVDPRVIPLGSRLFIPGYGHAIAGDTGGDIVGRRIDLAFDSNAEAIQFGRRPITIYVLDKKSR